MQEIINWLRQVEQLASNVYKEAADHFSEDQKFSSFLSQLSQDEAYHYDLIGSAAQCLPEIRDRLTADITIDWSTKERLEKPLHEFMELMKCLALTRQDIVYLIVKIEFSEWNDIFLYVINSFQRYSKEFQYVASTIQAHEKRIEKFMKDLPEGLKVPDDIYKLPRIWEQRFLIVEDEEPIRKLLEAILSRLGSVELAKNGQEAMDKIKNNFFNVVISDIDMPILDGLEFYQKAIEMDPAIGRHFLFCSGNITSEVEAFIREHDLAYLEKPFGLQQLEHAVQSIIDKTS